MSKKRLTSQLNVLGYIETHNNKTNQGSWKKYVDKTNTKQTDVDKQSRGNSPKHNLYVRGFNYIINVINVSMKN
ncbi:hypothetical protein NQ314_005274 [Rhamnusium bicolor]|uniref:Uncharacterized protein n=1 Tax=Rhamnusium bicolor TaxID=1586634 RepID=A0AAV8ZHD0_9CUCU|nr:hypothetical protein NQ314_005274 [Rhamnusium bicolor]